MTAVTCTNAPAVKPHFSPLAWLSHAFETHRERRALARLDAQRLEDIGVNYREAQREANRPVWDVPSHWTH
ncbi:DUF1127 domain-containing protein [Aliiroseovarius sp. 2305UL8-7]|uniref:DUF1127 domain-containing protein n=1 Tax=Aliiroseovarius conchicola TaxID=3121637 RepID=UPI00352709B9